MGATGRYSDDERHRFTHYLHQHPRQVQRAKLLPGAAECLLTGKGLTVDLSHGITGVHNNGGSVDEFGVTSLPDYQLHCKCHVPITDYQI